MERTGQLGRVVFVACSIVLGLAQWASAQSSAPREVIHRGWFQSFDVGVLTLTGGKDSTAIMLPEDTTTFVWSHAQNRYREVSTAEAMQWLKVLLTPINSDHADSAEDLDWRKASTGLVVKNTAGKVEIHIGSNNTPFAGKFVAFKDDVLIFQFTARNTSYDRMYGRALRFKMNERIPVFESVDGGEYRWIGTPRSALSEVKEGANVTIYNYYKTEDDEFYLVLVGSQKKT